MKIIKFITEAISQNTIKKIQSRIIRAGGKVYIVGGAVRDELIPGTPESKDIDFLITGIPLEKIARVLQSLGKVSEVGKSFGIVKATIDGEEFDFAIPRTKETKTGQKHTDFSVQTDYKASVDSDLARRDFTINALAKDVQGNVVDLFGGQEDIQKRLIRVVGEPEDRFNEDPLRILRAIQFAVRFNFNIEKKTLEAMKELKNKLATISPERILMEFEKAWTKAKNPELFVKLLDETDIGKFLFGSDFKPISLKKFAGTKEEMILANFIAFFILGGDAKKMRPTIEMEKFLDTARNLLQNEFWNSVVFKEKIRESIPFFKKLFESLNISNPLPQFREATEKIKKAEELPISPKELQISGNDIAAVGFKGKQIGQVLKAIMDQIYAGNVRNDKNELIIFIQSMKQKEGFVKRLH